MKTALLEMSHYLGIKFLDITHLLAWPEMKTNPQHQHLAQVFSFYFILFIFLSVPDTNS